MFLFLNNINKRKIFLINNFSEYINIFYQSNIYIKYSSNNIFNNIYYLNTKNQKMEQTEEQNPEKKEEINKDNTEDFELLPRDYPKFDYNFKIIIIGNSGVGKTCLTLRATTGEFRDNEPATLGFEYCPFFLKYKNKVLKLEIWDTCGQEAYRSLIKSFFFNSSLAIIVYSVDNTKSFDSIDEWVRQCKTTCSPDTKFFLIGNKADITEG